MDDDEVECLLATMIYKVRFSFYSFCFFYDLPGSGCLPRIEPLIFFATLLLAGRFRVGGASEATHTGQCGQCIHYPMTQ
jgi:hypothetical protein